MGKLSPRFLSNLVNGIVHVVYSGPISRTSRLMSRQSISRAFGWQRNERMDVPVGFGHFVGWRRFTCIGY